MGDFEKHWNAANCTKLACFQNILSSGSPAGLPRPNPPAQIGLNTAYNPTKTVFCRLEPGDGVTALAVPLSQEHSASHFIFLYLSFPICTVGIG